MFTQSTVFLLSMRAYLPDQIPQPRAGESLAVVLVVAAPPHTGLVATERGAVEPLIHAPQAIYAALVGRICVVYNAVLERKRAHAGPFAPVCRPVCPNARGERSDERIVLAALHHP